MGGGSAVPRMQLLSKREAEIVGHALTRLWPSSWVIW